MQSLVQSRRTFFAKVIGFYLLPGEILFMNLKPISCAMLAPPDLVGGSPPPVSIAICVAMSGADDNTAPLGTVCFLIAAPPFAIVFDPRDGPLTSATATKFSGGKPYAVRCAATQKRESIYAQEIAKMPLKCRIHAVRGPGGA